MAYTPNIPDVFFNHSLLRYANFLSRISPRRTILLPATPKRNCSGTLVAIELCYRTDRHDRTQTVVRILSFFEKWSRTLVNHNYAVVDRGSNDKCTRVKNSRICCTKVPLADRFKFVISPDFPVGIVTNPDGNGRPSLLTISSTERVNAYYRSVKDSWEHGEELKLATFQPRRDGFLPLMRFFIGKIIGERSEPSV